MKNLTLLRDTLLGTWTVWVDLRASGVGDYQVRAYTVVHFQVDPMQHYACQREDCQAVDGKVCQTIAQPDNIEHPWHEKCTDMRTETSAWSDMVMYLQTGFEFHAGAPFWMSQNATTGVSHWMGPYNIIWAEESNKNDSTTTTAATNDTTTYVSRYVQTYMTPFLSQRPSDETLLAGDEFQAALGPPAVHTTLERQVGWNWDWTSNRDDPYAEYKNNCQAGNLSVALPQYRLSFNNEPGENDNLLSEDSVNIQVDHAFLLAPGSKNRAYGLMPWMARLINRQHYGFSLEGPYCWGSDPQRAWLVDVTLEASVPLEQSSKMAETTTKSETVSSPSKVHLTRGCIEGFPCIPPQLMSSQTTTTTTVVLHTKTSAWWTIVWTVLCIGLGMMVGKCVNGGSLFSCCRRCFCCYGIPQEEREALNETQLPADTNTNTLEEPLLSTDNNNIDNDSNDESSGPIVDDDDALDRSALDMPSSTTNTPPTASGAVESDEETPAEVECASV